MKDLQDLFGTRWEGHAELWLDPLGDVSTRSSAALEVDPSEIRYRWSFEGVEHRGVIGFGPGALDARAGVHAEGSRGAEAGGGAGRDVAFEDTFHQRVPVRCETIPGAWGLLAARFSYPAPEGPPWGWRIQLALRPSDELVLQMTNVAPWGEETRAFRVTATRARPSTADAGS